MWKAGEWWEKASQTMPALSVVGYFLDHEKPKDEGKPKPRKRKPVSRKVSTKAKKRG